MTPSHDPYAAFRSGSYRQYVAGWFVTLLGTRIQSVAIGWDIYQRTGEAFALSMVGLSQALPTILLALPAGMLADRFHRRTLVMLSMAGMTLTSLSLAGVALLRGPVLLMYVLLFLDATAMTLGRPSRLALLPHLVPRTAFQNAVTWNTSMWQISSVVGPAIGGFVVAVSVPLAYVISAASSLLFICALSRVRLAGALRQSGRNAADMMLGGVRFVLRTRVILSAISLDLFAVLLGGAVYLLPIFAQDILGMGAQGYGWLRAAPAAGALLSALLMAHLPPMRRAGRNLLLAVVGFGVVTIVFGLSRVFWLSLLMLFLTGVFDNVSVVVRHTLVQLMTPDHIRGRVSAVVGMFLSASNELGGFESGTVAHFFGPIVSVVSGGIGTIIVAGAVAFGSPALRSVRTLHDLRTAEGPTT
jgi:MFS family permease